MQVDAQPKDDGSLLAKRQELQREVEQTKRALAQQNSLTAVEQVKVEQSIAEEERLLYDQSDLRIEVVELTRLAAIKVISNLIIHGAYTWFDTHGNILVYIYIQIFCKIIA